MKHDFLCAVWRGLGWHSWDLSIPNSLLSEVVHGHEAGPGVGGTTERCRMAGCRSRVSGAGSTMETLVLTQVTQTGEKERLGALVPGAETWSLRAPGKWLHRACPVHSASPRPTARGDLWEGDSPPRNLLVSVTLCPSLWSLQRQMLTAPLMAPWCFPPSALPSCPAPVRSLCSWFSVPVQQ